MIISSPNVLIEGNEGATLKIGNLEINVSIAGKKKKLYKKLGFIYKKIKK